MRSTACWTWDAQAMSASPDPRCGQGQCARTPDPCTTLACARSLPRGAQLARASTRWSPSKVSAGRSRTASRPPRLSSASITTKAAPGTAGTATSRWSCWHSPWWQPSATTRTGRLLRKLRAARLMCAKPCPLVAPGNPSRRHTPGATTPGATTYPPSSHHRLVALATGTYETKYATVMLGGEVNGDRSGELFAQGLSSVHLAHGDLA